MSGSRYIPLVLVAFAVSLSSGSARGAENDIADIRRQLVELAGRLDVLEQQNAALRAENETLKAGSAEPVQAQLAKQSAELEKLKGADWASRISVRGDLRYRHEQIADDLTNNPDTDDKRYRDRLRARIGVDARVSEVLSGTFMLASSPDDPRSSNQTLTGVSSRKSVGIDLAYIDWKYSDWGTLTAGKMRYPVVRPGQSLLQDGDINPEGLALGFRNGIWFGSAYHLWVEERSTAADTTLYGGQAGVRMPALGGTLLLTAQYSDLVKGEGFRPFYGCSGTAAVSAGTITCANGNTVIGTTAANAVLANDFNVVGASVEYSTRAGAWPLQVWADFARNVAADDLETAWTAGLTLGRAADRGSWEAGVAYESLGKDAIFGQLVDSDFGDGRTDADGWIFRGGYALARNWLINATWFLNDRQTEVGTASDYRRFMLDLNLRF